MSNLIGIVDYGVTGNIFSIKKALEKAGGIVFIINKPSDFERADKIVIPGVGSFKDAMKELNKGGFVDPIKNYKKPILGICLGMQILSTLGYEYGKTRGLDLISAETKLMLCDLQVPHMGFNALEVLKTNPLLTNIENKEFYFMHSYEVVNYNDISALTTYSGHKFVSVINKNNIYGVQFHPEKSRIHGIELLKNFIKL